MLRHRAAPGQGLVVVQRACARGGVGPGLLIARACSVDSRTCRRRLTVEALDQQHVAPSDGDDSAGGRMPHSAASSSIACSTRALFHSSSGRVNLASHSPSSSSATVFGRAPAGPRPDDRPPRSRRLSIALPLQRLPTAATVFIGPPHAPTGPTFGRLPVHRRSPSYGGRDAAGSATLARRVAGPSGGPTKLDAHSTSRLSGRRL